MKQLKLKKLIVGDADILSRMELKGITGGDYGDDTGGGLTCVRHCSCYNGTIATCDCAVSAWDCMKRKCGPDLGVCRS